jgi:hypothetical protein
MCLVVPMKENLIVELFMVVIDLEMEIPILGSIFAEIFIKFLTLNLGATSNK